MENINSPRFRDKSRCFVSVSIFREEGHADRVRKSETPSLNLKSDEKQVISGRTKSRETPSYTFPVRWANNLTLW